MEMIEKNIFRPLPILKKAPPPSEGIGAMEEEVFNFFLSNFCQWKKFYSFINKIETES